MCEQQHEFEANLSFAIIDRTLLLDLTHELASLVPNDVMILGWVISADRHGKEDFNHATHTAPLDRWPCTRSIRRRPAQEIQEPNQAPLYRSHQGSQRTKTPEWNVSSYTRRS